MIYYVIRNAKTGKYLNNDQAFSKLSAMRTWIFRSHSEAQDVIDDPSYDCLARVYKRCEVVPVELLRV